MRTQRAITAGVLAFLIGAALGLTLCGRPHPRAKPSHAELLQKLDKLATQVKRHERFRHYLAGYRVGHERDVLRDRYVLTRLARQCK